MANQQAGPSGLWAAAKAGAALPGCGRNRWPAVCCETPMSAIVYRVNGKSGDYIKTAIVPSNHSEEPRFGLLDGVIVSFLLLCACGLVCLLALS